MGMHHPGMNCGSENGKCDKGEMKCDDKKMCPHDMNMSGKDSACCKDEHHQEVEEKEDAK